MPTFAQIQEEISNMLDIPEEMLDESQSQAMEEYLAELGQQEASKVDAFSQFIMLESDRVKALKEESKRLAARAKAAENRIENFKAHYAAVMAANGLKKIRGDIYTLSLRKSESVKVNDAFDILSRLGEIDPALVRRKEIIEPEKAAIKEALKAGQKIPGCQLVEKQSLQIR